MQSIVYTNKNDCQDCYKCVRNCPVDSISMIDNSASIDTERCIMCGTCIEVCPVGAQHYRNDEDRVKGLLSSGKKVILSLAPSFPGAFSQTTEVLIKQLKGTGFFGVSETALGAQLVTWFQRNLLPRQNKAVFSTACPTFVHLVMKYYPNLRDNLSPLLSPLLSHCVMLRKIYGGDISIVFAGPCIAKKSESDVHPELLDAAITFEELKNIIKAAKKIEKLKEIIKGTKTIENPVTWNTLDEFIPLQSSGGAIYPLDGGMIETITKLKPSSVTDSSYFNYSGTSEINRLLCTDNFSVSSTFCEFLACSGGCINGSGLSDKENIFTNKNKVSAYFKSLEKYSEETFIEKYAPDSITTKYDFCDPIQKNDYSYHEKEKIWIKLGKYKEKDFLDCGGCGYDTCDNFAVACLDKRAELQMCVVSTKLKAQSKSRGFMNATPLGMCIIDEEFKIIECNCKFLKLSVDVDIDVDEELTRRVVGKNIDSFFKISDLVKKVHFSREQLKKSINKDNRVFDILIFPFEGSNYLGLIIDDITRPSIERDIVVRNSREVIKNNLLAVQKIAFLLGETAAETEITLNNIIDAYTKKEEE